MRTITLCMLLISASISFGQEIKIIEESYDDVRSLIYCIAADTNTYDKHFGDSYRLFLIKEANSQDVIEKIYLPVNLSPDFRYFLDNSYLANHDFLIIKGVMGCFLYYPDDFFLTKKINPDRSDCEISDGQGGYINYVKFHPDQNTLEIKVNDCQFVHEIKIQPYISGK